MSVNTTNTSGWQQLCKHSHRLAHQTALVAVMWVKVVFGGVTAVATAVLFVHLVRRRFFHPNIRIIFCNFATAMFLLALGYTWQGGERLVSHLGGHNDDECAFVVDRRRCFTQYLLVLWICVFIVVSVFLILAVERTLATVFYRRYENTKSPVIGLVCAALQWTLALITVKQEIGDSEDILGHSIYCSSLVFLSHRLRSNNTIALSVISSVVVSEAALLVVYAVVLYANHQIRRRQIANIDRSEHNLGERYQVEDNIRVTRLVAFICVCHATCVLTSEVFFIWAMQRLAIELENGSATAIMPYLVVEELTCVLYELLGLAFCVGCVRYSPIVQNKINTLAPSLGINRPAKAVAKVAKAAQGDVYFNMLDDMWAQRQRKSKP